MENKAIVLMYHRVANLENDTWNLAVSPENFEQQIQVLTSSYNVISVDQLIDKLLNKSNLENSICITFDDGYCDNYLIAKPLLEKYNCPATFFIAANYISQKKEFWWDELENILLNSLKLPLSISLTINQKLFEFHLDEESLPDDYREVQRSWDYSRGFPNQRIELLLKLWKVLFPLPYPELESIMQEIKKWSRNEDFEQKENFAMEMKQLKEISDSSLFNVGIHTLSHSALAFHSEEIQRAEIAGSKNYFDMHCGKMANTLTYPYGIYNDITLSIVKEQNIAIAFTTKEEVINMNSDLHQLGRFQVMNWNGIYFEELLQMVLNNPLPSA